MRQNLLFPNANFNESNFQTSAACVLLVTGVGTPPILRAKLGSAQAPDVDLTLMNLCEEVRDKSCTRRNNSR